MTTALPNLTRADIVRHARAIAYEYKHKDLGLTLRQLYYQFVARGLMGNGQKVYKRIGATLTEARYNGTFPPDLLVDRTREVHVGKFSREDTDIDEALDTAAQDLRNAPDWALAIDRWVGQPVHVSVWVEKEALAGVFERPCQRLGVSWFACKGYPSVSALWDWLQNVERFMSTPDENGETPDECVVLYFGDHDPDGFEIPRSAERNIAKLRRITGTAGTFRIRFEPMALTMDQIEQYDPPPFPAKVSSSRYEGYIAEHGTDDAWELDALDPEVLRDLITEGVERHFDKPLRAKTFKKLQALRDDMRGQMRADGWIDGVFDDE